MPTRYYFNDTITGKNSFFEFLSSLVQSNTTILKLEWLNSSNSSWVVVAVADNVNCSKKTYLDEKKGGRAPAAPLPLYPPLDYPLKLQPWWIWFNFFRTSSMFQIPSKQLWSIATIVLTLTYLQVSS